MSLAGKWIPVLVWKQDATHRAANKILRKNGYRSVRDTGKWVGTAGTVRHLAANPLLPTGDGATPPEIAGWFVIPQQSDAKAEAAHRLGEELAAAADSLVVSADGIVIHDGRSAACLREALDWLREEHYDEDRPIRIDWSALPGPSAKAFVIVYRGDRAFTPREIEQALAAIDADLDVFGAKADDLCWRSVSVIDPSLVWDLEIERGVWNRKLPFYVRARFDHGERMADEEGELGRADMLFVVEAARRFNEQVASLLALTPIEVESGG
jgi:hypothetical protein